MFQRIYALILIAAFAPSVFAAAPQPRPGGAADINSCDESVITSDSRASRGWASEGSGPWTVFNMQPGFAVCLYGDRYLVFKDEVKALQSVAVSSGTLEVRTSSLSGMKTSSFFSEGELNSGLSPYQGRSAVFLRQAELTFYPDGKTPARAFVSLKKGSGADFDKWYAHVSGDNWLWSNARVQKSLKSWLSQKLSSAGRGGLDGCAPGVRLLLDAPRAHLVKYLEVSALHQGKESALKILQIPVAEFVCEDADGPRVKALLREFELLKAFK
ncbi:MAG: hypothetical protein GX410_03630 [Elusimicrobia bacterium]|nr:hypothetical protein [Elusimicrobiota bacterium]